MSIAQPIEREGVLYIRSIPRDLKDQFKSWCALRGVSMSSKIEQLMRATVTEGRPKQTTS